jgi:hypothetical protein
VPILLSCAALALSFVSYFKARSGEALTRSVQVSSLLDQAWDAVGGEGTSSLDVNWQDDPRRLELAKRKIREALTIDPRNSAAHLAQSMTFVLEDRLPEAEAEIRTAILLSPADPKCHDYLGSVLANEAGETRPWSLIDARSRSTLCTEARTSTSQ